jgi:voltage-gated potassium channel Kch
MHISGYDWTYLWNSMWCVIITMTTVGYGDFVPKTNLGRTVAVLACIWGNFLISLMVISLTVSSEFTVPAHRKAFENIVRTKEEQE